MKTKLFTLVVALLATISSLFAYDFQSGDLYYNITSDTTVEVTYQLYCEQGNYSGLTSVNIPASVTYNDKEYNVTSIGMIAFEYSALTGVVIPEGVTIIGHGAFYECTSLTSVVIPNSVAIIGDEAFRDCGALTSLVIPDNVTYIGHNAFSNVLNIAYNGSLTDNSLWGARCKNGYVDGFFVYADENQTNLLGCSNAATGEIAVPAGVTHIGNYAFSRCSNLTSVILPEGVTSIEEWTFGYCLNLTSVTIPNSVTSIGDYAFYCTGFTSVTIPNSVTSIGSGAFSQCYNLVSVTIPNSVTSIGDYAFGGVLNVVYDGTATGAPWGAKCVNGYVDGFFVYANATKTNLLACNRVAMGDITIPNSVTSIGDGAFSECYGLTSVSIPNSVKSIGSFAFSGCYNLTSIYIPKSVIIIGENAFVRCTGLTSIVVESGNTIYDSRNNCNAIIETATNTLMQGCNTTVIPNSVTSIGEYAFCRCIALTSVTIPKGVMSIGNGAFSGCTGLTSITIPNSVTSIGDYAFNSCTGLTSITIPNSVTSIGENAFYSCTAIAEITCYATTVPETATYAFERVNKSAKLYVPKESVADYKAHPVWGQFDLILPLSTINIHDDSATGSRNAAPQKFFHNGQLYIRHGDKTYTPAGIEL